MKNILVNPKVSNNIIRKEVNDVVDQALIRWLIRNSYNPIIISNKIIIKSKKKFLIFLKKLKFKV